MRVSLQVSVGVALMMGMSLSAPLDARAQGATLSGAIVERPGAASKADVPARDAPPGISRDVAPSADEIYATNRKNLEQRAGTDAAKLLLRSVPGEALILIDGMPVGRAPLLLIVPPGKYKVEMRGRREASAERLVGLMANETQQVALTLASRYPARISVR